MKKLFLILIILINTNVFSQSQNVDFDNFILNFNSSKFETIYQTFSPAMKKVRTKEYYSSFLTKIKKDYGTIINYNLLDFKINTQNTIRYNYDTTFENGNLTIRITINNHHKITGLYFLKNNVFL
ncbi:MAG TPA: DUF3887 domain-containing protein [Flavobacterium sp.]|uniref:DUF3887 domain-containing protein n=1 Tax=Flavobacterium sp. TaxID=239 RepID=UPI002C812305|nr:DUF3887 domain-containing protein [Flavobacterium sp.]MCA0349004.1 DUF3887 domain-containing protein [Bacteroidota bacterium]HPW98177.1 DUF3887 domain-containing protein [Flavobacterium sp.]HQA74935.1 DUF3887 domain-containing protein [Flavobacterium sp.]